MQSTKEKVVLESVTFSAHSLHLRYSQRHEPPPVHSAFPPLRSSLRDTNPHHCTLYRQFSLPSPPILALLTLTLTLTLALTLTLTPTITPTMGTKRCTPTLAVKDQPRASCFLALHASSKHKMVQPQAHEACQCIKYVINQQLVLHLAHCAACVTSPLRPIGWQWHRSKWIHNSCHVCFVQLRPGDKYHSFLHFRVSRVHHGQHCDCAAGTRNACMCTCLLLRLLL